MERTLSGILTKRSTSEDTFLTNPVTRDSISFHQFYLESKNISQFIHDHGAKKGDRIAIYMENGIEIATIFFGITYAGQVTVPVNFSYKSKEIRYLLEDAGVKYILTTKKIFTEKENILREAFFRGQTDPTVYQYQIKESGQRDIVLIILSAQEAEQVGSLSAQEVEQDGSLSAQEAEQDRSSYEAVKPLIDRQNKEAASEYDPVLPTEDDLALILYTSGTTGNPKGVMLTHKNLIAETDNITKAHRLTSQDVVLGVLPLFHINGLVITLITPLAAGCEIIMPPKFSASNYWKWVEEYKVTWLNAVPTIYSILLAKEQDPDIDTSHLRFARSASSSLPAAVLEEFEARYHIPMIESYGISEGASQITSNPLPPQKTKTGSVGLAYGNEVQIMDDLENILPPRETGEIVVRGDNIALGYLNKPKETAEAFKNGWYHTGDMGYLDEEGYLFINGRKKELINRAGEKFSPREIDEVLYQLPQVELAAAVGVPNPLYNEEVVAYLKLREGQSLTEEEVIEFCKSKLADFKAPKEIFFTDDFPKGPSGKIQRLKFVSRYQEERHSSV